MESRRDAVAPVFNTVKILGENRLADVLPALGERNQPVVDLEQQVLGIVVEFFGGEQVEAPHAFMQVSQRVTDAVHRNVVALADALDDVSLDQVLERQGVIGGGNQQ